MVESGRAGAANVPAKARSGRAAERPLDICIVTNELFGFGADSDIGFACATIAQSLAGSGHNVTVLITNPPGTGAVDPAWPWFQERTNYYLLNFLVRIEFLPVSPDLPAIGYDAKMLSIAVYHWLKTQNFDVVYFNLRGGLGYFSILAKETGQYSGATLCTLALQPLEWQKQSDKLFIRDTNEITAAFMERYGLTHADAVAFPSRHMMDWTVGRGWPVAAVREALPPCDWIHESFSRREAAPAGQPVRELVFFGDSGWRRGLTLFCDALDRLAKSGARELKVTLLGTFDRILGEHTGSYFLRRAERWPFEVVIHPRLKAIQQIEYLRAPGRLAVCPALADDSPRSVKLCLQAGVPLVATRIPAIEELIAPEDRDACLAAPTAPALAALLAQAVRAAPAAPRRAVDRRAADRAWVAFSRRIAPSGRKATPKRGGERPLVSIIMPHYNRPDLFRRALASVERQSWSNIEVVMVDDGSTLPEALDMLAELEPVFAERGWTLIRQKNAYLGAARNAGIRASHGDYVLFLDDDNVLMDDAVERFHLAVETSGADICTCFSRLLFDDDSRLDERHGKIWYTGPGGSMDLAFLFDTWGDANAMFRRSVFERIGYLVEDYGFIAHDWEIFTRAAFEGLKVRMIPEPLYWYRSNTGSMYRSSHWYDTRQPIVALFKKYNFAGTEFLLDAAMSNLVSDYDQESYNTNLMYDPRHKPLRRLRELAVDSDEALKILAEFAAKEGHVTAALQLLSLAAPGTDIVRDFTTWMDTGVGRNPELDGWTPSRPIRESRLTLHQLREARVVRARGTEYQMALITTDERVELHASPGTVIAVVLPGALPPGTDRVMCRIEIESELTSPGVFALFAPEAGILDAFADEPAAMLVERLEEDGTARSDWQRLDNKDSPWTLEIRFGETNEGRRDLVLVLRGLPGPRPAVGNFSQITIHQALRERTWRHARLTSPPETRMARQFSDVELRSMGRLETEYASTHPVFEFWGDLPGFILRPRPYFNTVASFRHAFPPFARRLVASVEVGEDRGPVTEFAMALVPDQTGRDQIVWTGEAPEGQVAFSGWLRVTDKWVMHTLALETASSYFEPLTIVVATRVPQGERSDFNHAFWRKLVVA
jgi:glycosyltransferase involved in cell wall biosynthesis